MLVDGTPRPGVEGFHLFVDGNWLDMRGADAAHGLFFGEVEL